MKCLLTLAFGLALVAGGCSKPEKATSSSAESCAIDQDSGVLDVSGRVDGVYGIEGERLATTPLVHIDNITKTGEGVDPSNGKRWIGMHVADADARALRDFTAGVTGTPPLKKVAVVAGGELASVHKVRQTITTSDLQLSCCNPKACDRWMALLTARDAADAHRR